MARWTGGALLLVVLCAGCQSPDPIARRPQRRVARKRYVPRIYKPAPRPPRPSAEQFDPSWYPPGRRISPRWKTIVLHHSATRKGGAKAFDKFHRNKGWDELGYHFVIGNGTDTPDGHVEVGSRWRKQKHGAHCKTKNNYYNDHGIGICLVGDFTRTPPTARQLASLKRLTRFLTSQCRIAPSRVTTHRGVTHKTACPGRYFPLASVRRGLSGGATASSLP